jgi:hypothetical protein
VNTLQLQFALPFAAAGMPNFSEGVGACKVVLLREHAEELVGLPAPLAHRSAEQLAAASVAEHASGRRSVGVASSRRTLVLKDRNTDELIKH